MSNTLLIPTKQANTINTTNDPDEVAIGYYTGKLRQFEHVLNQYNFLDHAIQIQALCKDIKEIKRKLKALHLQKQKYSA